jgi:hypothetical protein
MSRVLVQVVSQGDAVCGESGYMLKRGENVAAFFLDGWGKTGSIYPLCTSSSFWNGESLIESPSITIEDGADDSMVTEICFPEFKGWNVHAVSGGKTMSICLCKE